MQLSKQLLLFFTMITGGLQAQSIGVKTSSPNTTLDVNGGVSYREGSPLILTNGTNNDIALADYSLFRIVGPTSAFDITGFTNGSDGHMLVIINATTQLMTLKNETTSSASNQITTGSGGDVLLSANGIASLMYNSTLQKWLLTASEGSSPKQLGIGITSPAYPLDVYAASNPMRLQGLASGSNTDSIMTINTAGVVSKRSPLNVFDDYVKVIYKTVTETVTSSTTLQDDNELFFTVNANEKWQVEGNLDVDGSSGHIIYGMVIPSGTLLVDLQHYSGTGIGNIPHYMIRSSGVATGQCSNVGTTNQTNTHFNGIVHIGGTAGTVKLQWAQYSSNSSPTSVKVNSWIKVIRLQ